MPPVTRRAFGAAAGLAGTLALVGVASSGCEAGSEPIPTPPTPDEVLVDTLIAAIRTVRDTARAAGEDEIVAMHTDHLAALGDRAGQASPSPSSPSSSPSAAVTDATAAVLTTQEEQLRAQLAAAAISADAGSLARVCASLSAAVAQRLVVLRG